VQAFTVEAGGVSLFVRDWGEPDRPALLYWDGLGGCGLHANEIAPILVETYGLRVVALDAPGHGRSPALPPDSYRPSILAGVAADLLSELGISRAIFMGFSWGGRIACSFGARFPERTAGLALIDGGYFEWADVSGTDTAADLNACIAAARRRAKTDSFATWEEYFAVQREELGRWTQALAEAHRAMMREAGGRIVPILEPEVGGAIRHGEYQEPLTTTYPPLADAEVPVDGELRLAVDRQRPPDRLLARLARVRRRRREHAGHRREDHGCQLAGVPIRPVQGREPTPLR